MVEEYEKLYNIVLKKVKKEVRKDMMGNKFSEVIKKATHEAVNNFHKEEVEAYLQLSNSKEISCSQCGYCCKNYKISMVLDDIEKLSKKINPAPYIEPDKGREYRYVFKDIPCKFLQKDNKCSIYDVRPQSCKNYPFVIPEKIVRISRDHNCNLIIKFFVIKAITILVQKIKEESIDVKN